MDFGDYRLAREFKTNKQSVEVKRVLDFSTLRIPLSEYDKLQTMLRKQDQMGRGQVVLVRS
jgi:hypothetical protein